MFENVLSINIFSRKIYEKLTFIVGIPLYLFFAFGIQQGWFILSENPFIKFVIISSVPLVLISTYLTSHKKIFPQRVGDCLQILLDILIISTGNTLFGEKMGINGPFFGGFVMIIPFYIVLLDPFLPIFTGVVIIFLLILEFSLSAVAKFSLFNLSDFLFKIIALANIAVISSFLINKILKEQKISQKLQEAYAELQKLDKAKTEFISIASHQLRTPLTAIKGYISMILEGTYGKVPKTIEKPVENISSSSERLIKLVNDLLNVSRIESGKIEIKFEKMSLEELIKDVIDELKIKVKKKNIYLKFEKPKESLPQITVDKDKMRQVVLNVVDNAIIYTNRGGVIVKLKSLNGKAQIKVKDTGIGLTKEELPKLFTSFSRGMVGSQLYAEGAGLGLYIAKKFVELHGGKIWAKSKGKGKGSVFCVELPIK